MRTLVWMIRELDITKEEDRKILLGELGKNNAVGQSKLDEPSAGGVCLATDKQKALMKKLKIVFDENTSKEQASNLISEKMG